MQGTIQPAEREGQYRDQVKRQSRSIQGAPFRAGSSICSPSIALFVGIRYPSIVEAGYISLKRRVPSGEALNLRSPPGFRRIGQTK